MALNMVAMTILLKLIARLSWIQYDCTLSMGFRRIMVSFKTHVNVIECKQLEFMNVYSYSLSITIFHEFDKLLIFS